MITTILAVTKNGYWFGHDINEIIFGTIAFFVISGLLVWKASPAIRKAMNTGRDASWTRR